MKIMTLHGLWDIIGYSRHRVNRALEKETGLR